MNVFWQELKMMRTGTIIWALALCGMLLMYIGLYPTFSNDAAATQKIFASLPPAIKAALNLDVDALLSFLGFFAFTFTNITLIASIHAMHTGVSIASRESRSKTTDFLLSKPRSRTGIFVQKYLAGVSVIIAVWIVMTAAAFGLAKVFGAGDFSVRHFGLLLLTLLITQLWFFTCGIFVAGLLPRLKSTIPTTLAVVFGFFMIGMLEALLNDQNLRYVSPFKFFNYFDIVSGKGYELPYLIVAGVSAVVMLTVAYLLYKKRDTRAVA